MRQILAAIFFLVLSGIPIYSQINVKQAEAFGDRLIIGTVGEAPAELNPFKTSNYIDKIINRFIFGVGLIQQEDRFGMTPPITEKFIHVSSDSRQRFWKYAIKRNIYFHNGMPVRNNDVLFTFRILKKWGGHILNRPLDFSNINDIQMSGDLEIQFNLKQADPEFDKKLSDIPILSHQYYSAITTRGISFLEDVKPLGYGPFIFRRRTDTKIELDTHPLYAFGRPFLDGISFNFYSTEQQMLDNFLAGNLDFIELRDRITAQRLHTILKNGIKIFSTVRPEKRLVFLKFNVNKFPFANRDERNLVRYAINTTEIVNRFADRLGEPAYSFVDRDNKNFFKDLQSDAFNPSLSVRLLQKNGWKINRSKGILQKKGREFSFELIYELNSVLEENIARSVKIYLSEFGINVIPKPMSRSGKKDVESSGNYQVVLKYYDYFDEHIKAGLNDFYVDVLKGKTGYKNYQNPIIENMIANYPINTSSQKQILQRFQIILHQDAPIVPLYFDHTILYAVRSRFEGIRISFSRGNVYYHRLNPFQNWFVPKPLQKY